MKRVFASQDPTAVTIIHGLLADEGVEATVQNENMSAVAGGVPFMLAMPEVWVVRDDDEARALAIVERFESGEARTLRASEPRKSKLR